MEGEPRGWPRLPTRLPSMPASEAGHMTNAALLQLREKCSEVQGGGPRDFFLEDGKLGGQACKMV